MYTAYTDFVLKSLQCLRKFAGRKRELKDSCIEYLLKIYFCLAWQNRLGLWAAMKVSSEVTWVWGGGILKVTTLFVVVSFQSGEMQVVIGVRSFLSRFFSINWLWSHLQSVRSGVKTEGGWCLVMISSKHTSPTCEEFWC